MVKSTPRRPTRLCRKIAGPGEVVRMTMHRTSKNGETNISRTAAVQKSNARFALDSHHWLETTIPVSVEKNFASLLLNRSLERDLNIQVGRSTFVFSDCDLL